MWKSAFRSVLLYLFLQEREEFYDSHNIKVSGLTDLRVVFFSNMAEQWGEILQNKLENHLPATWIPFKPVGIFSPLLTGFRDPSSGFKGPMLPYVCDNTQALWDYLIATLFCLQQNM